MSEWFLIGCLVAHVGLIRFSMWTIKKRIALLEDRVAQVELAADGRERVRVIGRPDAPVTDTRRF